VDRAALDVALAREMPCGGWCPKGRRAEDGAIDARYPLAETPSEQYPQRTEWNVRDADGTLILSRGRLTGGSALTRTLARRLGKPCLVVNLAGRPSARAVQGWLARHQVRELNVAGPRESQQPGIAAQAAQFLQEVLEECGGGGTERSASG
jgi:hypothetical protein